MSTLAYILLSVLLGALGQVFWKYGVSFMEFEPSMFFSLEGLYKVLLNGWIPAGVVCYFLSMTLWLKALKLADLSYVYPFISLNFVILTLIGALVFQEHVSLLRAAGVLLIVAGILAVAYS